MQSADFVVPRRRNTCLLTPPQHGGARSGVGLLRSAQRGSRYAVRRLRRPSQTKHVSAHSASARRRAIRGWIASLRSARIALCSPPTSSSLADETRVCSLRLSTAARDPGLDCFAPLSADRAMQSADFVVPRRRNTCLLTPPQHGGARSGVGLLRSAQRGSRYAVRRLRRPSQTKHVSAHSASARRRAIRGWIASLRSARIALCSPPTSSDRKSTRLNSSHSQISYAVFCLKKKTNTNKK